MNAVAQHKTRHIVSEIDIQLRAREQRRRCFVRTFGTPLRKLALGLRVRPAWWHGPALGVSFSLLPVEAIAALSSVTTSDLAVARVQMAEQTLRHAPEPTWRLGATIDVDVALNASTR